VRQRIDVSDSHSVDSHAVSMIRIASVYVVRPKLLPCTVTLADPVPARFTQVTVLIVPTSTDHASVTLPKLCPTVITIVDVILPPPPVRQRTDVSDSHCVDSHAVTPARAFSVYVVRPKLIP
jgi:hypothetical protein